VFSPAQSVIRREIAKLHADVTKLAAHTNAQIAEQNAKFVHRDEFERVADNPKKRSRPVSSRTRSDLSLHEAPDKELFDKYHDFRERTGKKIMQLTVYLWLANMENPPDWMIEAERTYLDMLFKANTTSTANLSGLALIFFSCRANVLKKVAYKSPLGRLHIMMCTQVVNAVFDNCRANLFASKIALGNGEKVWVDAKHGRGGVHLPDYLSSSLVVNLEGELYEELEAYSEEAFVFKVIQNYCLSPRHFHRYEPLLDLIKSRSAKRSRTGGSGSADGSRRRRKSPSGPIASFKEEDISELEMRIATIRYLKDQVRKAVHDCRILN